MEVSGNSLILYGNLAQKGMGCQGKSRGKPLFFKKLSPEDFLRFHHQWVRCVNNDPEFGTKYCRVFRISFYISIISIILSILIILSVADIFKNPPSSIHLENIKNKRMFYIKNLVMPLLA